MARIPYSELDTDRKKALAKRIIDERGSVLHLYQMLLHSPAVAAGWLNYLTAIRQESSLDAGLRELVIMRVAHVNGAPYEAGQHAPIALRSGICQDKLDALPDWESSADLYSAVERAVLRYTDAMTRHVHVPDAVFESVRAIFAPPQLIELTATIAAYNMVSRFLEALSIDAADSRP